MEIFKLVAVLKLLTWVDKWIIGISETWIFSRFLVNEGLKWHVKSKFHKYNLNFRKVDILTNKIISILLCSTAMQGMSKF